MRAGECRTCESESKSRIILSLNAGGSQVLAAVAGVRSEVCPGCFLRKVVAVRPEALWQLNVEGG